MLIGIDASRAFVRDKTGTETYSYHLIKTILRLPESRSHIFVLFIRLNAVLPKELAGYTNVIVKEVKWRYLWTQIGLAWETYQKFEIRNSKLELGVLWIPAHTLPILRNPKVQTVVTIHGLEYRWLREYKNWLQRWYLPLSTYYAVKSANRLIAVSKFSANQLEKELHTSKNKITVIHEGVESIVPLHHCTIAPLNKIMGKNKYVLFVGTIQPRKNLVALIQAFSQTPLDKLIIAGGIGWETEEIFLAAGKFGVQEKVVFTGRITDLELQRLYLSAWIYVQPSITEGFGLPVLEAMAYGVPVISSDGGALPEVVGEAGIVVPLKLRTSSNKVRNFVTRLARAMEGATNDQRLRKRLISMGYKRVKEFSWDKAAKATLKTIMGEGYKSYCTNIPIHHLINTE